VNLHAYSIFFKLPPVGTVPPLVTQALFKIKESTAPAVIPPAFEVACIKTFPPSLETSVVKTPVDLHKPTELDQVASSGQRLRPPTVLPAV
jgi:hypothetical protein